MPPPAGTLRCPSPQRFWKAPRRLAEVKPRFEQAAVNGSPADYVFAKNYHRRHLTDGAKQLAAGRYKAVAAKEAKERQAHGQKRGGETSGKGRSKADSLVATTPPSKAKARDVAGAKFGVGGKTVDLRRRVVVRYRFCEGRRHGSTPT